MNSTPLLAFFPLWIATFETGDAMPTTWITILAQYGLPTILLAALGWFTLWQEKQRNMRDEAARIEREKDKDALIAELHQRNAELAEHARWMREQIERPIK